jgi:hypothetical protein
MIRILYMNSVDGFFKNSLCTYFIIFLFRFKVLVPRAYLVFFSGLTIDIYSEGQTVASPPQPRNRSISLVLIIFTSRQYLYTTVRPIIGQASIGTCQGTGKKIWERISVQKSAKIVLVTFKIRGLQLQLQSCMHFKI